MIMIITGRDYTYKARLYVQGNMYNIRMVYNSLPLNCSVEIDIQVIGYRVKLIITNMSSCLYECMHV